MDIEKLLQYFDISHIISLVIGGIITLGVFFIKRKYQKPLDVVLRNVTKSENNLDDYKEQPSPFDLVDDFNKMNPFQQLTSNETVAGSKIKAECIYYSIFEKKKLKNNHIFKANFRHIKTNKNKISSVIDVSCDFSIEEFPIFKSLRKNQSCIIYGIVQSVSESSVNIRLVKIEPVEKIDIEWV